MHSFARYAGWVVAVSVLCLTTVRATAAETSVSPSDAEFLRWAERSLHPLSSIEMDAPAADLKPLRKMIGDKRIVLFGEGQHFAAQPLGVRNRVFKYLVEELGFTAIGIESGFTESRVVHDYVMGGPGELDAVVSQGITWTFDLLPQNKELIRWMREYNADPRHVRKIEFFGIDVPGNPSNPTALSTADTALGAVLRYLARVDPAEAERIRKRLESVVPATKWTVRDYLSFPQSTRDTLSVAVADALTLLERRQFSYVARSSKIDYAWAHRGAIAARQLDDWMRIIPLGAQEKNYRDWTSDNQAVRDRAMAENASWLIEQSGKDAKVLLFGALGHTAKVPFPLEGEPLLRMPAGVYLNERYGNQIVAIGHTAVEGKVGGCQRTIESKPMPPKTLTERFARLDVPLYLLDLRDAPASATWLREPGDLWNGFSNTSMVISSTFDVLFFSARLTTACGS